MASLCDEPVAFKPHSMELLLRPGDRRGHSFGAEAAPARPHSPDTVQAREQAHHQAQAEPKTHGQPKQQAPCKASGEHLEATPSPAGYSGEQTANSSPCFRHVEQSSPCASGTPSDVPGRQDRPHHASPGRYKSKAPVPVAVPLRTRRLRPPHASPTAPSSAPGSGLNCAPAGAVASFSPGPASAPPAAQRAAPERASISPARGALQECHAVGLGAGANSGTEWRRCAPPTDFDPFSSSRTSRVGRVIPPSPPCAMGHQAGYYLHQKVPPSPQMDHATGAPQTPRLPPGTPPGTFLNTTGTYRGATPVRTASLEDRRALGKAVLEARRAPGVGSQASTTPVRSPARLEAHDLVAIAQGGSVTLGSLNLDSCHLEAREKPHPGRRERRRSDTLPCRLWESTSASAPTSPLRGCFRNPSAPKGHCLNSDSPRHVHFKPTVEVRMFSSNQ